MGGAEVLLVLVGWGIPLALVVFVVSSLWTMTRSMGAIERQLSDIRELLERDHTVL
ncbi:MAG: hypothetical protein M3N53_06645 [Actinomycetota bacterium]|nr:hypothetical protein [Actinomycetota bacterium]